MERSAISIDGSAIAEPPSQIITAHTTKSGIDLQEVWAFRELIYFLVANQIKVRYAQSVFGVGWIIVQPLLTTIVLTIFFGGFARVSSDGAPYALFSLAGLVPWYYFSSGLVTASGGLTSNASILGRVYFPRIIGVLTPIISRLLDLCVFLVLLAIFTLTFGIGFNSQIMALPLFIGLMILTVLGWSLWLAPLSAQYRDVSYGLTASMQVLMYATPVIFPLSAIPTGLHGLYALYPMVGVIEGFRAAILQTTPIPWNLIAISASSALVTTVSGGIFFSRMGKFFDDVL